MFQREKRRPRPSVRERLPLLKHLGDRARLAQVVRDTAFRVADNVTRALSAGLSLADVRALVRGEPLPEGREVVFTNAFFAHWRPRAYAQSAIKFSNTFALGFLSVLTLFVQAITGIVLMLFYNPSADAAYASVWRIVAEIPFGQFVRDLHRLSADLLILFAALHLLRVYFAGAFKPPRQFTWVTGVLLLVLVLGSALTGSLLPYDQAAYWGVTWVTDALKAAPPREGIGVAFTRLVRGGDTVGAATLLRFYFAHIALLPALTLALLAAHYYRVARLHGISLPAGEEESPDPEVRAAAQARVDFLPGILTREWLWIAMAVCALTMLAAFGYHAPLGSAADATRAPSPATVSWYWLWLQGMRQDPIVLPLWRAWCNAFGVDALDWYDSAAWQGVLLPSALFLLLLGVPYLDEVWDRWRGHASSRLGHNRKLGVTLGLLGVAVFIWFTYLGTPMASAPVSRAAEIAQAFLPAECVPAPIPLLPADCGVARRLGYDGLPTGAYELEQFADVPPSASRFEVMLAQMYARLRRQTDLPDAKGFFIVADWQTDLKKITLRITWTPRAPDEVGVFERTMFLHRDSVD